MNGFLVLKSLHSAVGDRRCRIELHLRVWSALATKEPHLGFALRGIGMVFIRTGFGGTRVVDMLIGDPLPRIC